MATVNLDTSKLTNQQIVYGYLKGMGFSDIAAAGIMGNWQIESGFNPSAGNAAEGAIGLAQWEGGRRTQGLDVFAAQNKMSETDIRAQLGWFQKEITGPYSSVLDNLKNVRDPGTAAAIVDQHYEVSSGAARQARIDAANKFYQQIQSGTLGTMEGSNSLPLTQIPTITSDQLLSIHLPNIPFIPGLPSIPGLTGGSSATNPLGILNDIVAPIKAIGKFFEDLVWIFNVNHFFRACLYVFGTLFVIAGIYIAVTGVGTERPS